MPNMINKMIVRELSEAFGSAQGMVIVNLNGLSAAESEGLRTSLAEQGVSLRVVRNRLARRALHESGIEAPDELLAGSVAMAWGAPEDAINAAKVLAKSEPGRKGKVRFRGGLLEGNMLDASGAAAMAKLPNKDELRAMMLGVLSGPARGVVGLLAAPSSALVRVIQARVDEGGSAAEG